MRLREAATGELTRAELTAIRALMSAAFGPRFTDPDHAHALGGRHWLIEDGNRIVCHAAVVTRILQIARRPIVTGYVEAVATDPALQGRGLGSQTMRAAGVHIRDGFELGALSTGEHGFYERLGWERWLGPTSVRLPEGGTERTEDDDGGIMILRTPSTPLIDISAPVSCEWRDGDVW